MDLRTLDAEGLFSRIVAAGDDDVDRRARWSANEAGHLVEGHVRDGLAIDADQQVAGLQACLLRGRAFVHLDDARLRILARDAYPNADVGVVAARPRLIVLVLLRIQEVRVPLIHEANHAAD